MNPRVKAFESGYWAMIAALLWGAHASAEPAATPVLAPVPGVYRTAQQVSISTTTTDAKIYYTIDGTTPTTASTQYKGAFTVGINSTVRAIAVAAHDTRSGVAIGIYRIVPFAARPVLSPGDGAYRSAPIVSISDATSGATIYFTIDGTTPTTASTEYTNPITVSSTKTLKAIAVAPGYSQSPTGVATYEIAPFLTVAPFFSPAGGSFSAPLTVSISDALSGATIYYTTDGKTPTTASTEYTGTITVNANETLLAIAVAPGRSQSPVASATYALTATETVLYSFAPVPEDGQLPRAGLIYGADGNLYGTAEFLGGVPGGTVFKITPAGVESLVHVFGENYGVVDGYVPWSSLVLANDGNFYGATVYGGLYGCGAVFQLAPNGAEKVVYSFSGCTIGSTPGTTDGGSPYAPLIQATDGNLYGTTQVGGVYNAGTVYRITPDGTETVLYSFGAKGVTDGAMPYGGLVEGSDGNFYGTTFCGGSSVNNSFGCGFSGAGFGFGTVFKITPAGVETVLYAFHGTADGGFPYASLIQGSDGNFYGTTVFGGTTVNDFGPPGFGTVFKVTPAGVETVLHSFAGYPTGGGTDGANPYAPLMQAMDGNFYGTTNAGGTYGSGTVFTVAPDGTEIVQYSFTGSASGYGGASGSTDGAFPQGGLIQDGAGNFYGTTAQGGDCLANFPGCIGGTVFMLTNIVAE